MQRERTAEQDRQRIARARDEGAIKRWLILAPIEFATGQSGPEELEGEQIEDEGRLKPKTGEGTVMVGGEPKWRQVCRRSPQGGFVRHAALRQPPAFRSG